MGEYIASHSTAICSVSAGYMHDIAPVCHFILKNTVIYNKIVNVYSNETCFEYANFELVTLNLFYFYNKLLLYRSGAD